MGKLIVIEGMDGAGTTTQTKLLHDRLSTLGFKVLISQEPTKSAIGQECRRLLAQSIQDNHDLLAALGLCFAADRMMHINDVIKPGLKAYDFVVLDRYVLSSLVYQGLHLPLDFVREINRFAIKPDLTLVLDIDAPTAINRLGQRLGAKDFYETEAFLARLSRRYRELLAKEPEAYMVIDASLDVAVVHEHIHQVICDRFRV